MKVEDYVLLHFAICNYVMLYVFKFWSCFKICVLFTDYKYLTLCTSFQILMFEEYVLLHFFICSCTVCLNFNKRIDNWIYSWLSESWVIYAYLSWFLLICLSMLISKYFMLYFILKFIYIYIYICFENCI